jgi:hypothetical protein
MLTLPRRSGSMDPSVRWGDGLEGLAPFNFAAASAT